MFLQLKKRSYLANILCKFKDAIRKCEQYFKQIKYTTRNGEVENKMIISLFQYLENEAYEEELKRYEEKERKELDMARIKAREAVSYKSTVFC